MARTPNSVKKSSSKKGGKTHVFPGSRFSTMLRAGGYCPRVSKNAGNYLAGVISYLTHELLELSAKGMKNKNGRMTPRHVNLAVQADDELGALLKDVCLTQGGVVSAINPALERSHKKMSKKKKGGSSSAKVGKKAAKKTTTKKAASPAKKSAGGGGTFVAGDSHNVKGMGSVGGVALSRQDSKKVEARAREGMATHKWQYKGNSGNWENYEAGASGLVEMAYASWEMDPAVDCRSVKSGDWEYMVDFNMMTQQNVKHAAHTVRAIRRVFV